MVPKNTGHIQWRKSDAEVIAFGNYFIILIKHFLFNGP